MYDNTLGRWFNVDPLAEKYLNLSPYAYCANNSISLIDPNGMEFTSAAWVWIMNMMDYMFQSYFDNLEKIDKWQSMIDGGGLSAGKERRLNRRIDRLTAMNSEFDVSFNEIMDLTMSSQIYDLKIGGNIPEGADGFINFDEISGNVVINLKSGNLGDFAHELKHAYQFETGQMNLGELYGNFIYDLEDEREAFSRGIAFGSSKSYQQSKASYINNGVPAGTWNLWNHNDSRFRLNDPIELQNFSNMHGIVFRYKQRTYKPSKK